MWILNDLNLSIFLDGKAPSVAKLARYANAQEAQQWLVQLALEATHRYTIKNLPESCNHRTVIESLLYYGGVVFFELEGQILALPGLPGGQFTLYGDPVTMRVFGRNGYNAEIPVYVPGGDNSDVVRTQIGGGVALQSNAGVWVRENPYAMPFITTVMLYADKIANTMRTLDVTLDNIRRPYIITAEESLISSVKSFFNKRDAGESYIVSSGVFPADKIKMLPIETTEAGIRDCTGSVDWLLSQYRAAEYLDGNSTIDKKAEITIPELNAGDGIVNTNRAAFKDYMQSQLDVANNVLGTNMQLIMQGDLADKEVCDDSDMGHDSADNDI